MSVVIERETIPCGVCGAAVTELRRGRCWGCYTRWTESRAVGKGAECAICQERRRSMLRLVELQRRSHALCFNCAGRIARMDTVPSSLARLRELLERERRTHDQRDEGEDRRIFPRERRVGERRVPPRESGQLDAGPVVTAPDDEEIVIELGDADIESSEQTVVREHPAPGAPR